jgi:hypothetical protein
MCDSRYTLCFDGLDAPSHQRGNGGVGYRVEWCPSLTHAKQKTEMDGHFSRTENGKETENCN